MPLLCSPAPSLAPALIGWELEAHGVRGRITETEAYQGEDDLACHASKGRTPRSETLYAEAGTLYVYLCYGMHALLNIVCDQKDVPAAVLIRSLEIIDGLDLVIARRKARPNSDPRLLANGPAKLTQALAITTAHNRMVLDRGDEATHGVALRGVTHNHLHRDADRCPLRLLPPTRPPGMLRAGPRVGVAYAGPVWAAKPWRWWEDGFPVA
jgi:DNA-3-methyladenine glycosylase